MPKAKTSWVITGMVLVFFSLLVFREWHLMPDGKLHLEILSVGQGDSTLITMPGGQKILVDGGPDWTALAEVGRKSPFFDRQIDLLVLSHPNVDHMVSFPEFLRRYSVGAILLAGIESNEPKYQEILSLAGELHIPLIFKRAGAEIPLPDNASLTILWPPDRLPETFSHDVNEASLVALFQWNGHRMLFTGDIDQKVETTLVAARADLKADILKIPHHGSRYSSSTGFLLAVKPLLAVIPVGRNAYGHPHKEILTRLNALGIPVHRTDLSGSLLVVWSQKRSP